MTLSNPRKAAYGSMHVFLTRKQWIELEDKNIVPEYEERHVTILIYKSRQHNKGDNRNSTLITSTHT